MNDTKTYARVKLLYYFTLSSAANNMPFHAAAFTALSHPPETAGGRHVHFYLHPSKSNKQTIILPFEIVPGIPVIQLQAIITAYERMVEQCFKSKICRDVVLLMFDSRIAADKR